MGMTFGIIDTMAFAMTRCHAKYLSRGLSMSGWMWLMQLFHVNSSIKTVFCLSEDQQQKQLLLLQLVILWVTWSKQRLQDGSSR